MPAHHLRAHEYLTTVFAIGKVQIGYVRHFGAPGGCSRESAARLPSVSCLRSSHRGIPAAPPRPSVFSQSSGCETCNVKGSA